MPLQGEIISNSNNVNIQYYTNCCLHKNEFMETSKQKHLVFTTKFLFRRFLRISSKFQIGRPGNFGTEVKTIENSI